MRNAIAIAMLLIFTDTCVAQKHKIQQPIPNEIVIGRNSFIDVGPPFNYYDLTILRAEGGKTDVERISLTPPSNACYPQADIRVAHLSLAETLSHILEETNPCSIPEKKLRAELKRRNKGLVFSGMNISIQVECARGTRIIRADILDRDIFDTHPTTPQYTAWSRALFDKLDRITGDHPWDKPIFPAPAAVPTAESRAMQAIADGGFDRMFSEAPDRPSVLYRMAQNNVPRQPLIELTEIEPVRPTVYEVPIYPPIAKAARVQGSVEFHVTVSANGSTTGIAIETGPMMLRQGVTDAITKWKFSLNDSGKIVHGSIRFGLNCAGELK